MDDEVVKVLTEPGMTYEDLIDGQHFMVNDLGDIFRKVRWPGEKSYVINVQKATVHLESEFVGKPVIPMKVKEPMVLVKA